jgi:hypothetical protein
MSIRSCAWPECPARFAIDQGPSSDGWRVFASSVAKVLLCPFHSQNGHGPLAKRAQERSRRVVFACACDAWVTPPLDSLAAGLREWQDHVRACLEDEG